MIASDAARLLALASAYDGRAVPADDASAALKAEVWGNALRGITLEQAQRAVIDHYATSHETIMVSHVLGYVRRATPLPEFAEEPVEGVPMPDWFREQMAGMFQMPEGT